MKPLTNAKVRLSGEDGNAFFILARVKKAILRSNKPELAEEFYKKANSGNYDNLLQTCMEYVEVE